MTGTETATATPVDPEKLRAEVSAKYRDVAVAPDGEYHFHTGRPLAARLGYETAAIVGGIVGWNFFSGSPTDAKTLTTIVSTWFICPVQLGAVTIGSIVIG